MRSQLVPQNPEIYAFHPGRTGLSLKKHKDIFDAVLQRLRSAECNRWFNEKIAELLTNGTKKTLAASFSGEHSLANLFNYARFNDYNPDIDQGLSAEGKKLMNQGERLAATVRLGGYQQILLHDNIFKRAGYFTGYNVDTAGHIVHELFHVAGFGEEIMTEELKNQIHEHCGLPNSSIKYQ